MSPVLLVPSLLLIPEPVCLSPRAGLWGICPESVCTGVVVPEPIVRCTPELPVPALLTPESVWRTSRLGTAAGAPRTGLCVPDPVAAGLFVPVPSPESRASEMAELSDDVEAASSGTCTLGRFLAGPLIERFDFGDRALGDAIRGSSLPSLSCVSTASRRPQALAGRGGADTMLASTTPTPPARVCSTRSMKGMDCRLGPGAAVPSSLIRRIPLALAPRGVLRGDGPADDRVDERGVPEAEFLP
mmetsp:Transcript_35889/g.91711  ORF Transcript_35889/g.91711 Transcript_35889/m.91711 type:complete len:244 (+) Transcript_35889:1068-1799(+)